MRPNRCHKLPTAENTPPALNDSRLASTTSSLMLAASLMFIPFFAYPGWLPAIAWRYIAQGEVQQIGSVGIGIQLFPLHIHFGDYKIADGIRMDGVIDFAKHPLYVPFAEHWIGFRRFQPLELIDNVYFKLRTYPHGKLKGNVLVGESAAVPSGFGLQAHGICSDDKFLTLILKLLRPALFLIMANSPYLKPGL
jgi:hypothetical protein